MLPSTAKVPPSPDGAAAGDGGPSPGWPGPAKNDRSHGRPRDERGHGRAPRRAEAARTGTALTAGQVDRDVPTAVGRVLHDHLGRLTSAAASVDVTFACDVADRVARFTLHGGKRMRSQFLWWGLRACGGGTEHVHEALRVAAGLELLQTCALVHDDVMDNSALRRGGPALHADIAAHYGPALGARTGASLGTAAAILAGDLALAWADDLLADTELPPDVHREVRGIWRAMRMEMVAGQYLDLHGQATGSRSTARAIRVACLKSAMYSVERPLELGAVLAGADRDTLRALCRAGRCAGIAFQLHDDLQGVFGAPETTGKPSGDDIREGKLTYLVAVARARAAALRDTAAARVLNEALGDRGLDDAGLERVREVLEGTGARAAVESRIDRLTAHGMRHLAAAPLRPEGRLRLRALLRAVAGAGPDPAPGPSAGTDEDGAPLSLLPGTGAGTDGGAA